MSMKRDQDLHLDEIKRNGNVPLRPRLIGPLISCSLASRADILSIIVFGDVHRVSGRLVRFGASALGPQHQHGGGDP